MESMILNIYTSKRKLSWDACLSCRSIELVIRSFLVGSWCRHCSGDLGFWSHRVRRNHREDHRDQKSQSHRGQVPNRRNQSGKSFVFMRLKGKIVFLTLTLRRNHRIRLSSYPMELTSLWNRSKSIRCLFFWPAKTKEPSCHTCKWWSKTANSCNFEFSLSPLPYLWVPRSRPIEITAIIQRPSAYLSLVEVDMGETFLHVPVVREIELNAINALPTHFRWGEVRQPWTWMQNWEWPSHVHSSV